MTKTSILLAAMALMSSCRTPNLDEVSASHWRGEGVDPNVFAKALSHVPVRALHVHTTDIDLALQKIKESIPVEAQKDFPFPLVSANVYEARKPITLDVDAAQLGKVLDSLCRQIGASWSIEFGKGILLAISYPGDTVFGMVHDWTKDSEKK